MTKKQKEEAISFMYEKKVELVLAPYGVYFRGSCKLCYYDKIGDCPVLGGDLMCKQLGHKCFKTFFRKIKES